MITILNISDTKFSYNGIAYFKNFTPFVTGNKVSIVNTYDACISLTNFPTIYSDISVDGVTYGSVSALQNALLPVLFNRTFTQAGSLTAGYIPKATGINTLGNSSIYQNGNNIGIGVIPQWGASGYVSLEIGLAGTIYSTTTNNRSTMTIASNLYNNGTNWIYKNTAGGSIISQNEGEIVFERAASATSGSIATILESMRINIAGNIGISTTILTEKLNLDGNALLRSGGAIKFNRADNAIFTQLYDASSYFVLDNRNGNGFAFQSAGSNVVNITSGNLLGIGTGLSGSARLNILNMASAPFLALRSTNNLYEIAKMSFDQNTDILSIVNNQGASSAGISFGTSGTERVRITAGGTTLFRRTSNINEAYSAGFQSTIFMAVNTNGNNIVNFFNQTDTYVASIVVNASSVSYGTGSDYRLKEDLKDFNGLEKLSAIKVYDFKFKREGDRMEGVMAHELQEIVPYAVSGEKDGVDNQGNVKIQNVDYSKLVPILIKSIQELKSEIEILKN